MSGSEASNVRLFLYQKLDGPGAIRLDNAYGLIPLHRYEPRLMQLSPPSILTVASWYISGGVLIARTICNDG
jgi:hypothetical protein